MPRRYGTVPWASRDEKTGTRPYQKSDQARTRIRVLCQEEVVSLQSSAQAEGPSTRFLHPGPGEGLEKQGRIGRVKERKDRGEGIEVNKVLVPYQSGHSGQLSTSGGDQGQKGPDCSHWVWSIGKQAGP